MNREIHQEIGKAEDRSATQKTESDIKWWLALHRAPFIGPATFRKLLLQFDSPQNIFEASPSALSEYRLRDTTRQYLKQPDWESVEQDLAWLEEPDNHFLTYKDEKYPLLLSEIASAPPVLFIHGQPDVLNSLQIAMVGSRNPSPSGSKIAEDFAHHLATSGFTITSGLALGIDAASHKGAVKAGGISIAVTGTGLDRVYPARNKELAHSIAEKGALVSEFPPGTGALPDHFPRRNRVISGLSLGTLVVEAARSSGSLITAQHALEQGREVFAIPGSIHSPMSRGCHQLIRQGAKLVETADDILSELAPLALASQAGTIHEECSPTQVMGDKNECLPKLDPEYQQLINNMGYDGVAVDELVNRCQLTPESISSMLLIMELQGRVTSSPGGLYSLVHNPKSIS